MNINTIADSSLLQMNKTNSKLMDTMNLLSTGKRINKSSDSPSEYYSIKKMEQEVRMGEVASRISERELNAGNTRSTLLDSASNMVDEMSVLSSSAADASISQEEKNALQMQLDQTSVALDNLLKNNNLGSAADLGLSNLQVNKTDNERINALATSKAAFENLLVQNQNQGTGINHIKNVMADNQSSLVNTKAALSSIRDTDMANEAINLNSYKIMQNMSLYGVQNAQSVQKSVLNLFG